MIKYILSYYSLILIKCCYIPFSSYSSI